MSSVPPNTDSLTPLFRPKSIAIIGASDDPARISGRPLRYLREGGFKGAIYPINPKRDVVQGLRSYPSLSALPEVPDVALIAVSSALTEAALRECAAVGVKAVKVFAAGYAEMSEAGLEAQLALKQVANDSGIRMLGPNCLGAFSTDIGYYGTFSSTLDLGFPKPGGGLAVVSQSGAYGAHVAHLAGKRGLGVSYCLTTGNEADVDVSESLLWLIRQPDVRVVMVYTEGIKNPVLFLHALRLAHTMRKPLVFLKVGHSEVGQRAASSHTAALTGADAVYDAVFKQYGVHRAHSADEQLDVAYACLRGIFPETSKLGIITVSGGAGIHLSDAAERYGLDVSPMPAAAQQQLKARLPFATLENPVDVTAQVLNDMTLLEEGLALMFSEGGYGTIVGFFTTVPAAPSFAVPLREAIARGVGNNKNRLIVMCMVADQETQKAYEDAGYLVFQDEVRAVAAVAALVRIGQAYKRSLPVLEVEKAAPVANGTLSEFESKRLLAQAGVVVPPERLVQTADAAAAAADEVGYPAVLKIVSPDILHKSDIGGVALNLADADSVREAYDAIMSRVLRAAPSAHIDGVLVTRMAPKGVETIIGVARDATFGPVVMFGLGGVFVEVLKDVTFRLAPFDEVEALRMINEVGAASAMLAGVRGAAASDVQALAATLASVSRFAAAHADDIESVDINPFLVLPQGQGGLALDAAIVAAPKLN
ncbi:acetate--CoA ligase family protein [Alcaligenaceae bacterium]|nr:acetate--CoA ligase family protein [Alcaligenaceae bacterium]